MPVQIAALLIIAVNSGSNELLFRAGEDGVSDAKVRLHVLCEKSLLLCTLMALSALSWEVVLIRYKEHLLAPYVLTMLCGGFAFATVTKDTTDLMTKLVKGVVAGLLIAAALELLLGIAGMAAAHKALSDFIQNAHDEILGALIAGFSGVVIHQYATINTRVSLLMLYVLFLFSRRCKITGMNQVAYANRSYWPGLAKCPVRPRLVQAGMPSCTRWWRGDFLPASCYFSRRVLTREVR
jgi:hypothetical protein